MRRVLPIACVLLLEGLSTAFAQDDRVTDGPVLDADLEAVPEGRHHLADERGHRAVVLFYEDRPHLTQNDPLKQSLHDWIEDNHLEDRVVVYGVANLMQIPSFIPHGMVKSRIRPLVDRWGVDILLDWQGFMRRAPWPMQGDTSNVVILNRDGRLVWHSTGPVRGARHTAFFEALRAALSH